MRLVERLRPPTGDPVDDVPSVRLSAERAGLLLAVARGERRELAHEPALDAPLELPEAEGPLVADLERSRDALARLLEGTEQTAAFPFVRIERVALAPSPIERALVEPLPSGGLALVVTRSTLEFRIRRAGSQRLSLRDFAAALPLADDLETAMRLQLFMKALEAAGAAAAAESLSRRALTDAWRKAYALLCRWSATLWRRRPFVALDDAPLVVDAASFAAQALPAAGRPAPPPTWPSRLVVARAWVHRHPFEAGAVAQALMGAEDGRWVRVKLPTDAALVLALTDAPAAGDHLDG